MNLKNLTIKDCFLTFIKGILLGIISMGIPGLSASTIALIIGIYFLMVESISNFFKDIKHNLIFLISLLLGYGIGAIVSAFSITILFQKFPLVTTLIILGMIIGSLPDTFIKMKNYLKKPSCWITFSVVLVFLLLYNFLISPAAIAEFPNDPNYGYLIKMTIIGMITSATFIIPGIDFAVVFLSLGLYYPFMNMIADLVSFGSPEYFTYFVGYMKILSFYLIGYFVGMFIFSKIIGFLLKKHTAQTEFASSAFIVAAPIIVVKNCILDNNEFFFSAPQLILGLVLGTAFIVSLTIIAIKSYKNDEKLDTEKKEAFI